MESSPPLVQHYRCNHWKHKKPETTIGDVLAARGQQDCGTIATNTLGVACSMFGHFMSEFTQATDDFINAVSRPRWVERKGYKPYAQRSFDIGGYEYELMIYRRPLTICERVTQRITEEVQRSTGQPPEMCSRLNQPVYP